MGESFMVSECGQESVLVGLFPIHRTGDHAQHERCAAQEGCIS